MLFVVMTVLCVWLGFKVNAARRQKEAAALFLKAGGEVLYDYQIALNPPGTAALFKVLPNSSPSEPGWLRATIGDDYFRKVVAVDLQPQNGQAAIAESDLKQLSNLPTSSTLAWLVCASFQTVQTFNVKSTMRTLMVVQRGQHGEGLPLSILLIAFVARKIKSYGSDQFTSSPPAACRS